MDISEITTRSGIESLVAQYMAIERRPVTKLETNKSQLNTRLAMFSDLKTKLKALQDAAEKLAQTGSLSEFGVRKTTSSDTNVVTLTADTTASNGTHSLLVTQLAKNDTVVSNRFTSTATDIVTTEGTGTKTIRLTVNSVQTEVNVTISESEDNDTILNNIASAINSSDAEVTASVVQDTATTSKLVIRSNETGSTYGITLDDVTGTLLNTIGAEETVAATSTTGGYIYADSELNAQFKLDGIDITHNSNTITDVLTGVTLNLVGIQEPTANPVTLTIGPDKDTVKQNVQAFLTAYNDAITYLKTKTAVDPANHTRGPLAGESTFTNLRLNLRSIVGSKVSSVASGNPSYLSEVGITPASNGTLSISDLDDFNDALDDNVAKVADLFSSTNGIANQIDDLLESFVKVGGIVDNSKKSVNTQIRNIDRRIASIENRLKVKEKFYRQDLSKLQQMFFTLTMQQQIVNVVNSSLTAIRWTRY